MKWLYVTGKFLTFPGSFMRGFWEHLACRIADLPIERPATLNADESCGHVEHSWTQKRGQQLLVCLLPGFLNLLLGLPLFCAGFFSLVYLGVQPEGNLWLFILLASMLYLGVCLLCSLAPLTEDALHCRDLLYRNPRKPKKRKLFSVAKALLFLPVLCMRLCAFLERYALNVLLLLLALAACYFWL